MGNNPLKQQDNVSEKCLLSFGHALFADNDKELAAFMTTASTFDKARTDRDARIVLIQLENNIKHSC